MLSGNLEWCTTWRVTFFLTGHHCSAHQKNCGTAKARWWYGWSCVGSLTASCHQLNQGSQLHKVSTHSTTDTFSWMEGCGWRHKAKLNYYNAFLSDQNPFTHLAWCNLLLRIHVLHTTVGGSLTFRNLGLEPLTFWLVNDLSPYWTTTPGSVLGGSEVKKSIFYSFTFQLLEVIDLWVRHNWYWMTNLLK